MNGITAQGITSAILIPVAYFILKAIFKQSIMFRFAFLTVGFAIFASYLAFLKAAIGLSSLIADTSAVAVGIAMYLYINKILRKPLDSAITNVKALSEGDLDIRIEETSVKNELGTLNNSVKTLTEKLRGIIASVAEGANGLASSGRQFSNASEQISEGASEQASSVEEISSSMEQMTANIQQNSENAKRTEQIAQAANESIREVSDKATKALEASKTIAARITVINDIAFQTNLLALNAAVEAARAGEHGRGFAVVAAEVRKLAENSKKAADEIVGLSETALQITEEAGKVLANAIPQIENTSTLIQEIFAASMEQNSGADQINSALQQLNGVTQQNASSSEELAAAAEKLAGQAEELRRVVAFFKTDAYTNRNSAHHR